MKIIGKLFSILKTIFLITVLSVAMLSIGYILGAKGVLNKVFQNNSGPNITTNVASSIKTIEELGVLKSEYAGVIKYDDSKKIFDFNIPFTSKNALVLYKATLKAGVKDLSKRVNINVNDKSKVIDIQVPQVEILDSYINKDSIETYDQTTNVFNPITIDDMADMQDITIDEIEEDFYNSEALDTAQDNLEGLVQDYVKIALQNTECNDYTIEVSTMAE